MMTLINSCLPVRKKLSRTSDLFWLVILALAGLGGSLILSCLAPFVALAVALVGTMRRAIALGAMTAIWLANQFVGFVFYHFPMTLNTALSGSAVGAAVLLTTVVAGDSLKRATGLPALARLGFAFVVGFAVYEGSLFVAALFLGGVENFSLAIISEIGLTNLAWLVGFVFLSELVAMLSRPWLGVSPRLTKLA